MPGSRKCSAHCTCGKHNRLGGGAWNPFRHAKRDFGNVVKFGKKVYDNPEARKIISQVARTASNALPLPLQGLAGQALTQAGLGRRSLRAGGGRSLRAGGGKRRVRK